MRMCVCSVSVGPKHKRRRALISSFRGNKKMFLAALFSALSSKAQLTIATLYREQYRGNLDNTRMCCTMFKCAKIDFAKISLMCLCCELLLYKLRSFKNPSFFIIILFCGSVVVSYSRVLIAFFLQKSLFQHKGYNYSILFCHKVRI